MALDVPGLHRLRNTCTLHKTQFWQLKSQQKRNVNIICFCCDERSEIGECVLVSCGIVPVIPSFLGDNVRHRSVGEDNTRIRSPCSAKVYLTCATDAAMDKRVASVIVFRFPGMCGDRTSDVSFPGRHGICNGYHSAILEKIAVS